MRKALVLFIVMICVVLLSTAVFAKSWNVPTNVRIVQKSDIDTNGRIFGSIQAAIDSIIDASAANPYMVKVMPGIYDLGTAPLQMKPFVDVDGSGSDSTIITSSNNNIGEANCTIGTVVMASNTSIRNIKIVNRAPNLNGDYSLPVVALVFNNVEAKAEDIIVLTGSDMAPGGKNIGICTYGDAAHAILNNIYVETHNLIGQTSPIRFMGGKVTLTNSKLAGSNGSEGSVQIINNDASYIGSVTIINSLLEGTCSSCMTSALTSDGTFAAHVSNSIITLRGGAINFPIKGFDTRDFFMENTKITCEGSCQYEVGPNNAKIANSLLPGDREGLSGAKLINNYDENYNPIPNQ